MNLTKLPPATAYAQVGLGIVHHLPNPPTTACTGRWQPFMNKTFVAFVIVISACRNQSDLKLSELKFPFPDKAGILTNLVDSTILVLENKSQKDTIGLITYDEKGRRRQRQ